MRSLRYRLILVMLPAILLNTAVIVAAVFWGEDLARDEWRRSVVDESARRLAIEVERIWLAEGRLTVSAGREVFDRITHFTDELAGFAVYDANRIPVYHWRNQAYPGLSAGDDLRPRFEVRHGDTLIGWVDCIPSDFSYLDANRSVVLQMVRTLILGVMISVAGALLLSHQMSRRVAAEARESAALLERLAAGERGVPVPGHGVEEFGTITRAAGLLQDALEKEERQRRQWTQDIAHDLKTPVTALRTQLEAVRDGVFTLTPERYALLAREFSHIDRLVADLSLLARVESPRMTVETRAVDAASFLADLESRFTGPAQAAELNLVCRPSDPALVFEADPELLTRAANNLVQNAIAHSRPAAGDETARISVELAAEGDGIVLSVENPGRIGDAHLPRLFDRLYRGDSGRSGPGSGLGLAIVRAVADKHGGSVTARNTARGTVRMRLMLPRRD